jgi:hypothetical protein
MEGNNSNLNLFDDEVIFIYKNSQPKIEPAK